MSDYDSGDDLLADVNADALVDSTKRPLSDDQGENGRAQDGINKRAKVEKDLDDDRCDALALQLLKENFGYDDFFFLTQSTYFWRIGSRKLLIQALQLSSNFVSTLFIIGPRPYWA